MTIFRSAHFLSFKYKCDFVKGCRENIRQLYHVLRCLTLLSASERHIGVVLRTLVRRSFDLPYLHRSFVPLHLDIVVVVIARPRGDFLPDLPVFQHFVGLSAFDVGLRPVQVVELVDVLRFFGGLVGGFPEWRAEVAAVVYRVVGEVQVVDLVGEHFLPLGGQVLEGGPVVRVYCPAAPHYFVAGKNIFGCHF